MNSTDLLAYSISAIETAEKRFKIQLRLIGRIAVSVHCNKIYLPTKDIDFVIKNEHLSKVCKMFSLLNFKFKMAAYNGGTHTEFTNTKLNIKIDVYSGSLFLNHLIPPPYFSPKDRYTVPITQLFLSKLSIVEPKLEDFEDIGLLLKNHEIGNQDDQEVIQRKELRKAWCLGCASWGLSQTCLTNLKKMERIHPNTEVNRKVEKLQTYILQWEKSCCWKTRGKLGSLFEAHNIVESS